MVILDRTQGPAIKSIEQFNIKQADKKQYSNGLELYTVDAGSEEVVKIEWFFLAGAWFEQKPLVAVATNQLLSLGTKTKTAQAFSEKIDFYGATVRASCTDDAARITLYCLNKYLGELLPMIQEMIFEPAFSKNELQIFAQNRVNRLKVNNTKNEYVAKNALDEAIFGSNHPYGYYPKATDYLAINQEDLRQFHSANYQMENCKIIASGKIPSNFESQIEQLFGNQSSNYIKRKIIHPTSPSNTKNIFKALPNAVQAGIAIGKPFVSKSHEDYPGLIVANTIFGGYFGSRLMSNIREDKGYTYGIYSTIVPYINESFTYMATEVGIDKHINTVKEIKFESERLLNDKVDSSELDLVRNYLLGNFLSSIDGPFALADRLKGLLYYDIDYAYYDRFIDTIKHINAEELLSLYQQYFRYDEYTSVVIA